MLLLSQTYLPLKAIENKHILGWQGLTTALIQKHLPITIPSIKGYLKQEKQGLQSTSNSTSEDFQPTDEDIYPTSDSPNIKTYDTIYSITSKITRLPWTLQEGSLISLVEAMSIYLWLSLW